MSAYEFDPLTGLPRKKKAASSAAAATPFALLGGPSQYDGPGGGDPGIPPSYSPLAPTAPAPTTGTNYTDLINAALAPFQAQQAAEGVQDLTSRNNQIIRALGQLGQQFDLGSARQAFGDDFVNQAGFDEILGKANALAKTTTDAGQSYTARAAKAHKDAVRQIRTSLAARSALRSGETGFQLQEAQNEFDTGQYDARSQVQDFLGAVQQGYLQAQRERSSALEAARREEAARQAQLHPLTGTLPPPVAPSVPAEAPWQRALRLRSEAQNRRYGL